jgi:hypothetical protein
MNNSIKNQPNQAEPKILLKRSSNLNFKVLRLIKNTILKSKLLKLNQGRYLKDHNGSQDRAAKKILD